jgi:hypothetical protein
MVIALVTLVVITMIVAAAATAMPVQLFAASHGGETQAALMAASSGADYAYARLQENRGWRGNGDGSAGSHLVVNTPRLQVIEDEGNVIGLITNGEGLKSAFRLKFNFQNGAALPDDTPLGDPLATHQIRNQYLCFNNINQSVNLPTYEANAATGVVINTPLAPMPKFNAQIVVEGLAGSGLSLATTDNIETLLAQPGASRSIYRQHVATRFIVSGITSVDSVVSAANQFGGGGGGTIEVVGASGASAPKLRTLTNATIASGTTYTNAGDTRVADGVNSNAAGNVVEAAALQDPKFLRVKSTQVNKATSADTRLRAGTYVWRPNGGGFKLDYYEQNFDGTTIPAGAPTDTLAGPADMARFVSNGSGINFNFTDLEANITDKVFVDPQNAGTVTDMAILIEPAVQDTLTKRPLAYFNDGGVPGQSAILSGPGNLTVQGSIEGYGGLTADQNINFQGASALETDPENSICVYARGDINVSAIPDSVVTALAPMVPSGPGGMGMGMTVAPPKGQKVGHKGMGGMETGTVTGNLTTAFPLAAGDVTLVGIVYALGDFRVNLTSSLDPSKHGNFFMEGILSAYGGDPDAAQNPGANLGKGAVVINAKNSELFYDPSFLIQLQGTSSTGSIELQQTSWNLLP